MSAPRAKKRLGQHFLHDSAFVARIVDALAPRAGEQLIEIGPGKGALTFPLLARGVTICAIEFDRDMVAYLTRHAGASASANLRLVQHDALSFDYASLADDGRLLRLVGNLPYNIATELLFRLLVFSARIRDMHFMVQKEVADRLVAAPGSRKRGRLSLMIQAGLDVQTLFHVPPGAFTPPPAVDSSVVRLVPRAEPLINDVESSGFSAVVAAAFAQRRKTLRNALRSLLDETQIESAGVDPAARAEILTNEQFAALARAYRKACADPL